ncbi:MAG TPA: hypothetical protein VF218_09695, partial [Acidothermaceae bacterium]
MPRRRGGRALRFALRAGPRAAPRASSGLLAVALRASSGLLAVVLLAGCATTPARAGAAGKLR